MVNLRRREEMPQCHFKVGSASEANWPAIHFRKATICVRLEVRIGDCRSPMRCDAQQARLSAGTSNMHLNIQILGEGGAVLDEAEARLGLRAHERVHGL